MDIGKILKNSNFDEEEKNFLERLPADNERVRSTAQIAADLLLGKKIEAAANKIVESNKNVEESNIEHSKAMLGLTGALVLVGIAQVAVAFTAFYDSVYQKDGPMRAIVIMLTILAIIGIVVYQTRSFWREIIKKL